MKRLHLRKFKTLVIIAFLLLGQHFSAWGTVFAEQLIYHTYVRTRDTVVQQIATSFGYAKPEPKLPAADAIALVEKEALRLKINPSLARALMHVESRGNQFAVSPAGAIGLMQVMPFNAGICGLKHYGELFNDEQNIKCGMKILDADLRAQKYNVDWAIQAYNGGPKCINKCDESINHARKVLTAMAGDIR